MMMKPTDDQYSNDHLAIAYAQALGYAWGRQDAGEAVVATAFAEHWMRIVRTAELSDGSRPSIGTAYQAWRLTPAGHVAEPMPLDDGMCQVCRDAIYPIAGDRYAHV